MRRFAGVATTAAGVRSAAASIRVVLASDGVTLVNLYSTNDLAVPTPLGNPFNADASGVYSFYARNGRYTIIPSVGTPVAVGTLSDVLLYDPIDELPGLLPGNVIDAKAYGVVADGVTDDTAAMRAALNALNTTAGGVLILPAASTILVSDFLGFPAANIEIRGGGPGTVIEQTVGDKDLFQTNGWLGLTIRDLAVTRSATDISGAVVNAAAGSDDLHLINIESTGFGAFLVATTCVRVQVLSCTAHDDADGRVGVTATSCQLLTVRDSEFGGFAKAFVLTSCLRTSVLNVHASPDSGNTAAAFTLIGCTDTLFGRIIGSSFNSAFDISTSNRTKLSHVAWGATSVIRSIFISDSDDCTLDDVVLVGVAAGIDAINVINSDNCAILNCRGNGALSFINGNTCVNLTIRGNIWTGAATNVVSVIGQSSYGLAEGNNFYFNGSGIVLNGSAAGGAPDTWKIRGNIVRSGTGAFAVGVELYGTRYCTIADNFFVGNNNGIHLENTDAADPVPNRFCTFNLIEGNYCLDNNTDGIYTQNHAQNAFIGNTCIGNGRHGIAINSGTQIDVEGNTCNCNAQSNAAGVGISVDTTGSAKITGNTCARLTSPGHIIGLQAYGILIGAGASSAFVDGNYCHGNVTAQLQDNGAGTLLGTNWTT